MGGILGTQKSSGGQTATLEYQHEERCQNFSHSIDFKLLANFFL